jgi:hypothetical protein
LALFSFFLHASYHFHALQDVFDLALIDELGRLFAETGNKGIFVISNRERGKGNTHGGFVVAKLRSKIRVMAWKSRSARLLQNPQLPK